MPPLVLLAAGRATRLGQPKALVRVDGQPFHRYQLGGFARAGGTHCRIVLGHHLQQHLRDPLLAAARPFVEWDGLRVEVRINPHPERGMRSSLDVGLEDLRGAAFVLPIDCPAPPSIWGRLLAATGGGVVPTVGGRGRHPVLLDVAARRALGESGAPLDEVLRGRLRRVPVDDLGPLDNLNRRCDWRARFGARVEL